MAVPANMKNIFVDWYQGGMKFTPETKRKIQDLLVFLVQCLPEEGVQHEMTYNEAIRYFVTYKPRDPAVKKGAILKQRVPDGIRIARVFLDEQNRLISTPSGGIYGNQVVVEKLDQILLDTFGNTDVIIVE